MRSRYIAAALRLLAERRPIVPPCVIDRKECRVGVCGERRLAARRAAVAE